MKRCYTGTVVVPEETNISLTQTVFEMGHGSGETAIATDNCSHKNDAEEEHEARSLSQVVLETPDPDQENPNDSSKEMYEGEDGQYTVAVNLPQAACNLLDEQQLRAYLSEAELNEMKAKLNSKELFEGQNVAAARPKFQKKNPDLHSEFLLLSPDQNNVSPVSCLLDKTCPETHVLGKECGNNCYKKCPWASAVVGTAASSSSPRTHRAWAPALTT
ncbi:hypothetical protein KIL84_002192 [Mauremys mutica]|uniref:Uncharacterized protein n=1 Tax=Mauremys mutica TaxID=74926 RepID=A0A9D4B4L0_9SAUR|nr:hypothetical protein KIL84_002192 [Mauremys mutica]